jgi:putative transcriptional regulator
MTLTELLKFAGYDNTGQKDASTVFLGGPVQPSSGWIMCIDPEMNPQDGVIPVGDRIRITSSRWAFDALARDVTERKTGTQDSKRRMVMLGYSGWGPGQLEGEIAAGAWLPVFDVAIELRWERAFALLGLTPAVMMSMRSVGDA